MSAAHSGRGVSEGWGGGRKVGRANAQPTPSISLPLFDKLLWVAGNSPPCAIGAAILGSPYVGCSKGGLYSLPLTQ